MGFAGVHKLVWPVTSRVDPEASSNVCSLIIRIVLANINKTLSKILDQTWTE